MRRQLKGAVLFHHIEYKPISAHLSGVFVRERVVICRKVCGAVHRYVYGMDTYLSHDILVCIGMGLF